MCEKYVQHIDEKYVQQYPLAKSNKKIFDKLTQIPG